MTTHSGDIQVWWWYETCMLPNMMWRRVMTCVDISPLINTNRYYRAVPYDDHYWHSATAFSRYRGDDTMFVSRAACSATRCGTLFTMFHIIIMSCVHYSVFPDIVFTTQLFRAGTMICHDSEAVTSDACGERCLPVPMPDALMMFLMTSVVSLLPACSLLMFSLFTINHSGRHLITVLLFSTFHSLPDVHSAVILPLPDAIL